MLNWNNLNFTIEGKYGILISRFFTSENLFKNIENIVTNKLFEYKVQSSNLYNWQIGKVFILPLAIIVYIFTLNILIWFKILILILLITVSYSFYKNTPFIYNRIILTKTKLIITKGRRGSKIIDVNQIKSINSNYSLTLGLKNGNKVEIRNSDWMMPMKEKRKLKISIEKIIEENTTGNIALPQ